jgi:hypothetical protein
VHSRSTLKISTLARCTIEKNKMSTPLKQGNMNKEKYKQNFMEVDKYSHGISEQS